MDTINNKRYSSLLERIKDTYGTRDDEVLKLLDTMEYDTSLRAINEFADILRELHTYRPNVYKKFTGAIDRASGFDQMKRTPDHEKIVWNFLTAAFKPQHTNHFTISRQALN